MPRILLTGGSGFIAAHILDTLLQRGHSVVTTVRSGIKGQRILDAYPENAGSTLDYVNVEDIEQPGAFDKAVISEPPFDFVIHTASPYHFKSQDNQKELLGPAVNGTIGLLESIVKNAPSVKRVVITSSSAAILDPSQPTKVYSEADWCPITKEQALLGPANGYRASKTFAKSSTAMLSLGCIGNGPHGDVTRPLVLGPVLHHLDSLAQLNTSNQRIRDLMTGAARDACPPTGNHLFVDVRDLAMGHALAAERPDAAGRRFFMVGAASPTRRSPRSWLPIATSHWQGAGAGDYPSQGSYGFDNSVSKRVLGMTYRPLRESVADAVTSLQRFLA
ncbi:hypothetical protein PG994_014128 [Apiospora phragmitis]|uniref:NAD-dependent epimerase/dehydratase domain-containing protein n=1 Tax=Apiospora phragmitis TaxID=2905665 RepID=A0ABR1T507_9PEZI